MSKTRMVDESDSDVPLSERGKGENMPLEERSAGFVFGLVGLSYLVILVLFFAGLALWWFI